MPQPNLHCMIDLETMGLGTRPAIVSIGAVILSQTTDEIIDHFEMPVTLTSSMQLGLEVHASTVEWWMQQSDAARAAWNTPEAVPLAVALQGFANFLNHWQNVSPEGVLMWGNGAAEDLVWLASAYKAAGHLVPWGFRNQRCYRTLKNLLLHIDGGTNDNAHNALADAMWQAKHLNKLLKEIPQAT